MDALRSKNRERESCRHFGVLKRIPRSFVSNFHKRWLKAHSLPLKAVDKRGKKNFETLIVIENLNQNKFWQCKG